jgi:hypothetical protein
MDEYPNSEYYVYESFIFQQVIFLTDFLSVEILKNNSKIYKSRQERAEFF